MQHKHTTVVSLVAIIVVSLTFTVPVIAHVHF